MGSSYVKLVPEDRCLLQSLNKNLCTLGLVQFDGQLLINGEPVSDANPLPVESGPGGEGLTDTELRATPVPVSVSGVSTAANQAAGNIILTSIDGKTPAVGQALMAASTPVVIASNQSWTGALNLGKQEEAVHVTGDVGIMALGMRSDTPSSTVSTTGRYTMELFDSLGRQWVNTVYANTLNQNHSHLRTTALTNTPLAIKGAAGNLYGMNVINPNATPVYLKFYNVAAGSVVVGTGIIDTIIVPAADGTNPGSIILTPEVVALYFFSTAISVAAVTGIADADNTAPSTALTAKFIYA
jgi:hypothetical protein